MFIVFFDDRGHTQNRKNVWRAAMAADEELG
jgi:hypothetical protein